MHLSASRKQHLIDSGVLHNYLLHDSGTQVSLSEVYTCFTELCGSTGFIYVLPSIGAILPCHFISDSISSALLLLKGGKALFCH